MSRRVFIIVSLWILQFAFQLFFKVIQCDLAFHLTTIVVIFIMVILGITDYFCKGFSNWLDKKRKW